MKITHRDYQDFKDDKLVAMEMLHVPLSAQVTHLIVCKGVFGRILSNHHQLTFIEYLMNNSLYIELSSNVITIY